MGAGASDSASDSVGARESKAGSEDGVSDSENSLSSDGDRASEASKATDGVMRIPTDAMGTSVQYLADMVQRPFKEVFKVRARSDALYIKVGATHSIMVKPVNGVLPLHLAEVREQIALHEPKLDIVFDPSRGFGVMRTTL